MTRFPERLAHKQRENAVANPGRCGAGVEETARETGFRLLGTVAARNPPTERGFRLAIDARQCGPHVAALDHPPNPSRSLGLLERRS